MPARANAAILIFMGAALGKDFKLLGLAEGCSLSELKSAFRQRAKACHPDLSPQAALDFPRLRDSYQRLLDHLQKKTETARLPRSRPSSGAQAGEKGGKKTGAKAGGHPEGKREAGPKPQSREAERLYRAGLDKFEAFQSINRDRSIELKFLYSLTKKNIALVDLQRLIKMLAQLERSARDALGLLSDALRIDPGQSWAADAGEKLESLQRQLARCSQLQAELAGR